MLGQAFLGVQYISTHCADRYKAKLSLAGQPVVRMAVSKQVVRVVQAH